MSDRTEAIQKFSELTDVPESVAEAILERNDWVVEEALDDFYNGPTHSAARAHQFHQQQQQEREQEQNSTPSSSGSGHSSKSKSKPKPTFKSFSELVNQDQDEADDDEQLYAGGGRGSGLNVENPNNPHNLVQDLLKKAEEGGQSSNDRSEPSVSQFNGVGYTLGDNNTPSRTVGRPAARKLEKAHRRITFWKDGFQVGEEERLYRYNDPANASYLAELNAGRAPLSLLNVEYGQEVDVEVAKNLDQEYQPPKRKAGGFQGRGHRLGSPVSPDYQQPISSATETESAAGSTTQEEKPVEETGDSSVQIRFANGRRVVRKFNSTDPVQKVYDFVQSETSDPRSFTLNYSFPVKPIEDLQQTIKEAGIANSVVVQRWIV